MLDSALHLIAHVATAMIFLTIQWKNLPEVDFEDNDVLGDQC